jgi:hypothetical protein
MSDECGCRHRGQGTGRRWRRTALRRDGRPPDVCGPGSGGGFHSSYFVVRQELALRSSRSLQDVGQGIAKRDRSEISSIFGGGSTQCVALRACRQRFVLPHWSAAPRSSRAPRENRAMQALPSTILVTGATGGIGLAACDALAKVEPRSCLLHATSTSFNRPDHRLPRDVCLRRCLGRAREVKGTNEQA